MRLSSQVTNICLHDAECRHLHSEHTRHSSVNTNTSHQDRRFYTVPLFTRMVGEPFGRYRLSGANNGCNAVACRDVGVDPKTRRNPRVVDETASLSIRSGAGSVVFPTVAMLTFVSAVCKCICILNLLKINCVNVYQPVGKYASNSIFFLSRKPT